MDRFVDYFLRKHGSEKGEIVALAAWTLIQVATISAFIALVRLSFWMF